MYDVQPADEDKWISPPFAAEIHDRPGRGPCIIARGAVNSKGALCGVFNTLRTMKDNGGIPLNLIFTIDGEEEIGAVLRTRTGVKPLYISIGHRLSLATALDYVLRCTPRYRLPETTRQAHRLASG